MFCDFLDSLEKKKKKPPGRRNILFPLSDVITTLVSITRSQGELLSSLNVNFLVVPCRRLACKEARFPQVPTQNTYLVSLCSRLDGSDYIAKVLDILFT